MRAQCLAGAVALFAADITADNHAMLGSPERRALSRRSRTRQALFPRAERRGRRGAGRTQAVFHVAPQPYKPMLRTLCRRLQ